MSTTRGRCIKVVLLSQQQLKFFVEGKSKVQEVYSQVCEHLSLRETEYFGLAKLADGEYEFLDATSKFHKLLPKQSLSWRAHKQEERVSLTLYFRVQYYVEHISLLKERATRTLYYQQLKDNLLHYAQEVSEETCFQLAAYSLQADLGNYQQDRHGTDYFQPRDYFPAWIVEKRGADYIKKNTPLMHAECHNMPRPEAYKLYIRDLSKPQLAHNMHMYRVKKQKQDEQPTVWIAVSPSGIYIYQDAGAYRTLLSVFEWKNIGRLHFEKKKFEIQPSGSESRKFRYYTRSEDRGKHLLGLCKRSHQFQLAMAPKLAEQRHLEAEDRRFREAYIHSDRQELSQLTALGRKLSFSRSPGRLSNASSATTSGIASERLHTSLDEHDEVLDTQEILINSPPQVVNRIHSYLSGESGSPAGSVLMSGHSPHTVPCRGSSGRGGQQLTSVSRQGSGRSPGMGQLGPSISRTSSAHSQRSLPPPGGLQQPSLVPADAHLQKMAFPKNMMVTSNPVVQRMGASGGEMTQQQQGNPQGFPMSAGIPPGAPRLASSILLPHHTQQQQPQFASSLMASVSSSSSPKDHTYANFESIQSQPIYSHPSLGGVYSDTHSHYQQSTHASYQDLAAPPVASYEVRSNLVYTDNSPQVGYHDFEGGAYHHDALQMPYTPDMDLSYLQQQQQEGMVPGSRPPPVSRARDFIVTRPNRSYSQVTPPNKVLSPPQRAVSNADAYLGKRPNRVDCPVHGIRTDLFQEIQAKSSGKNLPLLAALCRDKSLLQAEESCCCAVDAHKRLSLSHPASSSSTPDLHQPGSLVRPLSWHEPTNLDLQQLQVFRGSIHIDDRSQKPGGAVGGQVAPPYSGSVTSGGGTQGPAILPYNGVLHQSMESLDYPTMLTYTSSPQQPAPHPHQQVMTDSHYHLPPRLHSGGLSGAQSVDNLLASHHHHHHQHMHHQHHLGLGIAT